MKANLRALKPTPLGIFLILLALLLQAVFFSSSSTTFSLDSNDPAQSSLSFGLGSPITIIKVGDKTILSIKWVILVLNLAITYALAVLAGTGLAKITRLRRPASAYGLVASITVAVTFLVSIGISKAYWGYFISRPESLSEVSEIVQVEAIIPFKTELIDSAKRVIVPDGDYSLADRITSGKADSYYCLSARILIELERRNLLPIAPATTLDLLPELYPLIQNSGALEKSSEGYDSSARLGGVVVDAVNKSGDRLVFLGITGGQLSDDHYPCYEMLFRGQKDAAGLSFARGQRFFYDVAGMEGFEWYSIWIFLSVPGIVAGFLIFTIGRLIWNWKARRA